MGWKYDDNGYLVVPMFHQEYKVPPIETANAHEVVSALLAIAKREAAWDSEFWGEVVDLLSATLSNSGFNAMLEDMKEDADRESLSKTVLLDNLIEFPTN